VQLDANRSGLITISTWDGYMVLHRICPLVIHVSKVILRDPIDRDVLNTYGTDPDFVDRHWNPLKLLFAILLTAGGDDELRGYVRDEPVYMPVPEGKGSSGGRRPGGKRKRVDESGGGTSGEGDERAGRREETRERGVNRPDRCGQLRTLVHSPRRRPY